MATNTYVALDTRTITGSATNTVTFTSIPATYTDLVIVMSGTTSSAAPSTYMIFNNDATALYSWTYMTGNASAATSGRGSNQNSILVTYNGAIFTIPNTNIVQVQNYSSTTMVKTVLSKAGQVQYGADAIVGMWRSTAAINRIDLTAGGAGFAVGSTFSIYGIAAEATTPAPKATGGVIYSDSLYYYHVFGSTGVFTPSATISGQYLVVAGGGGGGSNNTAGGGGGAGGYRSAMTGQLSGANSSPETAVSLVSGTNYTVTIGGGGGGGGSAAGTNGTASSIIGGAVSISSTGGGGGGQFDGQVGGSGGGAGMQPPAPRNGAAGTALQGLAGGNGLQTSVNYSAGGGGGAGAVGSNGINGYGGNGGAGITANLYGVVTFGGGGGGGNTNDAAGPQSAAGGLGGLGGGGNGARGSDTFGQTGFSGTANTGGGGGGGGTDTGTLVFNGGAGGSGIVMIRYLKV
jgi:hypothetical protein